MAVDLGTKSFEFNINRNFLIDPKEIVLGDVLAEGDHFMVYKAVYKDDIPVAVKMVETKVTADLSIEIIRKFESEVRLLSKTNHENIAKFIGVCVEPRLMVVTELLEGGTLQQFLLDYHPNILDLKTALCYALDISKAMEFLHSKRIVHGQLKPRNLLMTGDHKTIKLAGFGIPTKTETSGMTYVPDAYRWTAPEVYTGEFDDWDIKTEDWDRKVDVWSFGLILWELVSDETPFAGIDDIDVPGFASKEEMPNLGDTPHHVDSMIYDCWCKYPHQRPEFKQLSRTLTNLIRSLSYSKTPATSSSSEEASLESVEDAETDEIQECNSEEASLESGENAQTDEIQECNSEEASLESGENAQISPVQECTCKEMKPKEKKKKKKKVVRRMLPFINFFKACLYKS